MKNFPKVAIVILNYNGKDVLLNCLAGVFQNDYPNFEVVVVDNVSGDGSLENAKKNFTEVTYIENEKNLGFSAGNNVGIKYSLAHEAEYVLLLNNDTVVEKDFLSALIRAAGKDEKLGILCPLIFEGDGEKVWFSGGRINWLQMRTVHERKNITEFQSSAIATGCAMLIKKEVFDKVGMLDEDYFLYWEDTDFSARATRAGYGIGVEPKSRLHHLEISNVLNPKKIYHLVLSGLIFFQKNTPVWARPWIYFFTGIRRIKNWIDRRIKNGEVSGIVHKAYQDFYGRK